MPLSNEEREEIAAVRDSDGRGLPIEAIIASQRYLAEKCLELDGELRSPASRKNSPFSPPRYG